MSIIAASDIVVLIKIAAVRLVEQMHFSQIIIIIALLEPHRTSVVRRYTLPYLMALQHTHSLIQIRKKRESNIPVQ